MKQAFLGSLFSCLLVGQIFGAAYDEQEHSVLHILSLQQLCTNALVSAGLERPTADQPSFMDGVRSEIAYQNAENLSSILPDYITDDPNHNIRVKEALKPWKAANQELILQKDSVAIIGGMSIGVLGSMISVEPLLAVSNKLFAGSALYAGLSESIKEACCFGILSLTSASASVALYKSIPRMFSKNEHLPMPITGVIVGLPVFSAISGFLASCSIAGTAISKYKKL